MEIIIEYDKCRVEKLCKTYYYAVQFVVQVSYTIRTNS